MASGQEEKKEGTARAFAGLSSMVYDVVSTVEREAHETEASSEPAFGKGPTSPSSSIRHDEPTAASRAYQAPVHPTGWSPTGKWLLGIGVATGLIRFVFESGNKHTASAPRYTPAAASAAPVPRWQPPVAAPQLPSRLPENMPPIGSGNLLTAPQIRYCVSN